MTKTYTTISGDTWDIVAYKVFGDEGYTDKIIKANLQHKIGRASCRERVWTWV